MPVLLRFLGTSPTFVACLQPPHKLSLNMVFSYDAVHMPHGDSGVESSQSLDGGESSATPLPALKADNPPRKVKRRIVLPSVLHLVILAFYIALWVVRAQGAEQFAISYDWAAYAQSNINLVPHYIMIALQTAIVYVMQPVAIMSAYSKLPQPLTTLSDMMTAWKGLGAALSTLKDNFGYRVALMEAIVIAAYFTALTGLGTSSSYIFTVPLIRHNHTAFNTTWLGTVPLDQLLPINLSQDPPSNFSGVRFDWYKTSLALESNFYVNEEFLPGVDPFSNRVFDTLDQPFLLGFESYARVNYTEFRVQCGSVPQASLSATALSSNLSSTSLQDGDSLLPTLLSINYTLASLPMTLSDNMFITVSNLSNIVSDLWQPSNVLIRIPTSTLIPGIGRNVVLYNIYNATGHVSGSRPIIDSDGFTGSPLPLDVQLPDGTTFTTGLMIQVIGCSLSTVSGHAMLDASTNLLVAETDEQWEEEEEDYPLVLNNSETRSWQDWQPDLTSSTAPEDTWSTMFLPDNTVSLWRDQPSPPDNSQWSCLDYVTSGNNSQIGVQELQGAYRTCHVPTLIEDYLTKLLFGSDDSQSDMPHDISLLDLEAALARATTLMMWSAAVDNGTLITYTTTSPITSRTVKTSFGSADVIYSDWVGQVNINLAYLILGTVSAVVLTALGAYFMGLAVIPSTQRRRTIPVEDVHLLSLMAVENSAVASRLSRPGIDDHQLRRRAGNFPVKIEDGRLVPVGPSPLLALAEK